MSAIKLEKTYPIPKEIVWEHLIKDELLSAWCMPCAGFALSKGQAFDFNIPPNIFFSGIFHNKVVDFSEYKFVSYQCTSTKPQLDTLVKWTLADESGKTKLTLEHSGFKGSQWLTKIILASGWKKMMYSHLHDKLANIR